MLTQEKKLVALSDYTPPTYGVETVHLTFDLGLKETIVQAEIHFVKKELDSKSCELKLHGRNLKLLEIILDEEPLSGDQYELTSEYLILPNVPNSFVLKTKVAISPINNTELYGVYYSNGFICSHNEPEGFRNITYFLDRPDVMAKFTTTLIGSEEEFPVLLSNGNLIEKKHLANKRHSATWEDPFKKPCYLFAIVAGKLDSIHSTYLTKSKKNIELSFYTEPGKKDKALFAMECLKNAMRFDEEVFGLEYDLSCYMIVAVDFFNMGAMENKGLNIFNTTTCFADPLTATDDNFLRVETVIGHEYFHNYSGNRVGVRDWFQLTLKEGLTVFRDQEFTCYLHDHVVKRIEDVVKLRARQFPEDQGPTAHPIQPKEYLEINNFYTPTIYDKGAEVVRMYRTLLGDHHFFQGLKIFFERYDGVAATIQDFRSSMEKASSKDLGQFESWYHEYGTPVVTVDSTYEEEKKCITIEISQKAHPNHHFHCYTPRHFPLKIGLIDLQGHPIHFSEKTGRKEFDSVIVEIKQTHQTIVLEDVEKEGVLSINRNFSAPIELDIDYSFKELEVLAKYDTDLFNRYESFQKMALEFMQEEIVKSESNEKIECDTRFLRVFGELLKDEKLSFGLKAKILKLPEENELALQQEVIFPQANYLVKKFFTHEIAKFFKEDLLNLYQSLNDKEGYVFTTEAIGKRRLKNLCLSYLAALEEPSIIRIIKSQFDEALHMTDQFFALDLLAQIDCDERKKALEHFYHQFEKDPLTLIKWIACQASSKLPDTIDCLKKLVASKGFDFKMPNHIRALYSTLAENLSIFHDPSGKAYEFYFEAIKKVDTFNPQTAAIMAQSLKRIHQLSKQQKKTFKKSLDELLENYTVSPNVLEILTKIQSVC